MQSTGPCCLSNACNLGCEVVQFLWFVVLLVSAEYTTQLRSLESGEAVAEYSLAYNRSGRWDRVQQQMQMQQDAANQYCCGIAHYIFFKALDTVHVPLCHHPTCMMPASDTSLLPYPVHQLVLLTSC